MKTWIRVANSDDVALNGGGCVKLGGVQIALFKLQSPAGEATWYAVQNRCPHDRRQVLSSGLIGDAQGEPKVVCPLHKNAFSLRTGAHLGAQDWTLETFPVREVERVVFIEFDTARLTPPAKVDAGVSREPGDARGHGLRN
jgi:nitrite reductase (NADH) small subunit